MLDAAFLAREKAKADAEYYAARKLADSNKVSTGKLSLTLPPHRRAALEKHLIQQPTPQEVSA